MNVTLKVRYDDGSEKGLAVAVDEGAPQSHLDLALMSLRKSLHVGSICYNLDISVYTLLS